MMTRPHIARISAALALSVGLCAGCGSEKKGASAQDQDDSRAEPGAAITTPQLLRDAAAAPAMPREPLGEHMRHHFASIRRMERGVVAGELDEVRAEARELAAHEEHPTMAGWDPEIAELRSLALRVAEAEDVEAASAAVASLGAACADCHTTMSAIVTFEWSEAPAASEKRVDIMRRHLWAADRLWEGIVGPSEDSWRRGAEIFSEQAFSEALAFGDEDAAELAARIRDLGGQAVTAPASERPSLYGQLLSTCSGCHQVLGAEPDPASEP